eukprot:m.275964 g.275964  ORF g.275964 m.275964 type:complete len:355 (-) comp11100_c2_seq10:74-1138(-)
MAALLVRNALEFVGLRAAPAVAPAVASLSSSARAAAPFPTPHDRSEQRITLRGHEVVVVDSHSTNDSSSQKQQTKEPVIVALHGCPGTTYDFRYLDPAVELAGARRGESVRFLRVGLPGHDQTPVAACPDPSPDALARFVLEVVDELGLGKQPLFFLGHSLGSQIAIHLAAHHRERTAGIVLLANAVHRTPHRGIRPWWLCEWGAQIVTDDDTALVNRFTRFVYLNLLGFNKRFTVSHTTRCMRRIGTIDFERNGQYLDSLRENPVPVLYVYAEDDALIEPEITSATAASLPESHVTALAFPTGGHHINKDRANDVAASIVEWLFDANATAEPLDATPSSQASFGKERPATSSL